MKKQKYKPSTRHLEKAETIKRNKIRKAKAGYYNPKIEL